MSLAASVVFLVAVFGLGEWLKARLAEYPFDRPVKTVILDFVLSVEFCIA